MSDRSHPNVVFMLIDNLGWGDVGCYGGAVPTPRIDALAAQGVRFKNYNVESQCTPTRSAILPGRLTIRTGNWTVPFPGQGDYGLAPWEYTLGELFSDAGYATAAYGKWHVGEVDGRLPTDQGLKVVFRYAESQSGPIIKPQLQLVFDLLDDPGEEHDLMTLRMDCGFVTAPIFQRLGALEKSFERYPNIKPGQEFSRY